MKRTGWIYMNKTTTFSTGRNSASGFQPSWERCSKCENINTFYSYNGEYPLCKKCYLAWMASKESTEYAREVKEKKLYKQARKMFVEAFEEWLGKPKRKKEKVEFT
jgi:hypothetical protein